MCYNGHKRTYSLKFQAITAPDGLFLHAAGPIEGRRHYLTLYMRSGLDEAMESIMQVDGVPFYIYGDAGYNHRWFLEVPCQGSKLKEFQKAFNKARSGGRIIGEWIFKELKQQLSCVDIKRKMILSEGHIQLLHTSYMFLPIYG